jgi:hypothetical protein
VILPAVVCEIAEFSSSNRDLPRAVIPVKHQIVKKYTIRHNYVCRNTAFCGLNDVIGQGNGTCLFHSKESREQRRYYAYRNQNPILFGFFISFNR